MNLKVLLLIKTVNTLINFLLPVFALAGIFYFDTITPFTTIHWIFYIFPLLLSYRTKNISFIIVILFCIISCCIIGAFFTGIQPLPDNPALYDLINRFEGIFVFVSFTVIIIILTNSDNHHRLLSNELLISEKRYREIIENTSAGYFFIDQDGIIQQVNSAWLRIHKYDNALEVIGQPFTMTQLKGDPANALIIFKTMLNDQLITKGRIPHRCKDGSVGWHNITILPVKNQNKIIGIEGFLIDITDQKLAEEEANKAHLLFQSLFNLGPLATVLENQSDRVIYDVNNTFIRLFGYQREEIKGKSIIDLDLWAHPEECQKIDQILSEKGSISNFEFCYKNKEGITGHALIYASIIEQNMEKYYAIKIIDITERIQMEDALAIEKERLAVTLNSIGEAVIAADVNGNITFMNQVAEELTGWHCSEITSLPFTTVYNIINQITRQTDENLVEKVLISDNIVGSSRQTVLLRRDGKELLIEDCCAPIRNLNGQIIGVVLIFKDITLKTKMEKTLQNAQKLESIGVLAGGIAHDFNNLLGGIFGYIDLAAVGLQDKTTANYLEKALATIDSARALTRQLLTFAKGGVPIKTAAKLIPFLQETAEFALRGANITCHYDIQEDLWSCDFDKKQIEQVIHNMIINAKQAMQNGGIIEITAQNIVINEHSYIKLSTGKYVKISITDHGIGIAKDILPNIFDPFFTTKPNGHGLGLATCHSIISRHGGIIEVESKPGKGSTFHFYLPAITNEILLNKISIESNHKSLGLIVIMDDEEFIRDAVSCMLKSLGYQVICTREIGETIDFFINAKKTSRNIIAMIFDLTIPGGLGGKEAVKEIRKIDQDIPVFVASGYADDPVMANPLEHGFTASINKPFRKNDLAEILKKFL